MRRLLVAAAVLALAGCAVFHHHQKSGPYDNPFYVQFLDGGRPLDRQIGLTISALQKNPNSPALHNQLGQLLVQKGFPKDAAREFERSVNLDRHFYAGWYNLGLVRAGMGDFAGAKRAFEYTVALQKGHAEALFQLGLMAEKAGQTEDAINYYAKAFRHNRNLLDVRVNPSVVDSKLIDQALLRNYPVEHARERGVYMPTPPGYVQPQPGSQEAPSPQAPAQNIVPPAAPVTNPATQAPPPAVPPTSTAPRTTT